METVSRRFGRWQVQCMPDDGARVSVLRFDGCDLLSGPPEEFRPPTTDYGLYETRPVYGYDDCFPTMTPCDFPGEAGLDVPDHGLLCWAPWQVTCGEDHLTAVISDDRLPIEFTRCMRFGEASLDWEFEVANRGDRAIPFLHVMHPMMPLDQITGLRIPKCGRIIEEFTRTPANMADSQALTSRLLRVPAGTVEEYFLLDVEAGWAEIDFGERLTLRIEYPLELFPSLDIWWNNGGHPGEEGLGRTDCAVEPHCGVANSLAESHEAGVFLTVGARGSLRWTISWKMQC